MAGSKAGGAKASRTNIKKYGKDYYSTIGKMGGSVSSPKKGFGSSHERAVVAGKKGGSASRRGKAKPKVEIEETRKEKGSWLRRKLKNQA